MNIIFSSNFMKQINDFENNYYYYDEQFIYFI